MIKKEIWKDVPNYEGYYQASNLGRVRSLDRRVPIKKGVQRFYKGCIINGGLVDGYRKIRLSKNGNSKTFRVSQVVAMAFLGHTPDGYNLVVDHINGIKTDDRIENLRIVTHRENVSTCFRSNKSKLSSIYSGVSWYAKSKEWVSQVNYRGIRIHLGCFCDELDASNAYKNAVSKIENGRFNPEDYKPDFSSQYKGVVFDKSRDKWQARISINGKQKYLGRFHTELEAHNAYQNALKTKI